ncbi:MAG: precorrin-8X methylmutase [Methanosarcinales archaeon]|nr:precorrin-8X methylmutase [Methanosarcinales archaeon]
MDEKNYSDLGATTPQALRISRESRKLISQMVGDRNDEDRIRQRCVIATGDPEIAALMRFSGDPVPAGLQALQDGATIYVDIRMVEAGVTRKGHQSPIVPFIGQGDEMARELGITRTSAGVLALKEKLSGSIVVIGNAPTALMALCQMMEAGEVRPALVIGVPVGFVEAAESKERLQKIPVPQVSNQGTRGGTPIAVAAMNEIINIYHERSKSR